MCVCLLMIDIYIDIHLYLINYLRNVIMIDIGLNPTILEEIRNMFADQVRFLEWSTSKGMTTGEVLDVSNKPHCDKTSVTQDSYCSITFIVQFISCVTFTVCEI